MKNRIIFFLVALLAIACNKEERQDSDELKNDAFDHSTGCYMGVFLKPDSLKLEFYEAGSDYPARIKTNLSYDNCWPAESKFYAYSSKGKDFDKYKWYAKYYGDTTYYDLQEIGGNASGCLMPLKGIAVVADKALDEKHPAGTVLNDLFLISYARLYQYIQGGYKPQYRLNEFALKSTSELSMLKDVNLFSEYSELIFKQQPAPGKYTFTVTLDFGEDPLTGEKVTVPPASIEIEF